MPDNVVRAGMPASLTGQFASQGVQALRGAQAWVEDCNANGGLTVAGVSRPVELVWYDDESSTATASEVTRRLITQDAVDLLFGPYASSLSLAAAPVAEELRRVLWCHGGASDDIYAKGYKWVVGILTPASRYLEGVIDIAREADASASRLAVIASQRGSFPRAVVQGAVDYARSKGFEVCFDAPYTPPFHESALDFAGLQASTPDVVIGVGRIQDDLELARMLSRSGLECGAVAVVVAGVSEFAKELSGAVEGYMGPSQWEPAAVYRPDYGPTVEVLGSRHFMFRPGGGDYAMAQAYAAGLIAQRCVEETGSLDNGILRAHASALDFRTFYGRFKIDAETGRQVGRSVVIVQWQHGRKVVVWPPELRQADPVYPVRLTCP